ncbi:MAG: hypothetical protein U5R31_17190 [Acidimicrobiia bacterium]|nr:hypothetical protein [Acidimicrobiia bacterium]
MLDPRPRLDEAAQIAARYGHTGWLISETVTAGLTHGGQLWFGSERNIGKRLPRDRRRPRHSHPRCLLKAHSGVSNAVCYRYVVLLITVGDLADEFADALAEPSASDPLLGCRTEPDR